MVQDGVLVLLFTVKRNTVFFVNIILLTVNSQYPLSGTYSYILDSSKSF